VILAGGTWEALVARLETLPGAVVAYSGGVDSGVLLAACLEVLGADRTLAAIADSPSLARSELADARALAAELGAPLQVLDTRELADPRYAANSGDRCFWCKEALFVAAAPLADARGWALLYGENADDAGEDRPGARSAAQRRVGAPLREAGWGKAEVRAFARARGLRVADKPAMPCLASRLPVGVAVTAGALAQVEGLEAALRARGYRVLRARHHSAHRVRLEFAPDELGRALGEREALAALALEAGYAETEIDTGGYRTGGAGFAAP